MTMFIVLAQRPATARAHRCGAEWVPLLGRAVLIVGLLGGKDLTGSSQLPAGTQDPSFFNTPSGALGMQTAAVQTVEQALPSYILDTGLLTDELESNEEGVSSTT